MTRDEAIKAIINIHYPSGPGAIEETWCARTVDIFVALGMLKLDEPKMRDATGKFIDVIGALRMDDRYVSKLLMVLDSAGLKIVEK